MERMRVGVASSDRGKLVLVLFLLGLVMWSPWWGCGKEPERPEAPTVTEPLKPADTSRTTKLTVFAPWPMELRLRRAFEKYQLTHPNTIFQLQTGKPGPLIKRMKAGDLPDVYISMGPVGVEKLRELGLLREGSPREILEQRLILVCSDAMKDTVKSVQDLAKPEVSVIAMPPPSLSAGVYSHQALEELGLLQIVLAKERISPYSLFIKGEVDVAIMYEECVYEEDLWPEGRVPRRTINVVEPLGSPFPVIAVAVKGEGAPEVAQEFINFLTEPEAQRILKRR